MTDYSKPMLAKLQQHRLPDCALNHEFIHPYYEGLSLVNIPGTVARCLGAPPFGQPPLLQDPLLDDLGGGYKKVILLLVDALGYQLLTRLMQIQPDLLWNKYLDQAVFSPLTSVSPSTTATALTTLWTGQGPAAHGIIGYEMWSKQFGMIINNILHTSVNMRRDVGGLSRAGFDPHAFLDMPLLGTHLVQHGISATTFIHSSIAHSGLSVMQMEDVRVHAFVDEADLCVSLAEHVNRDPQKPEYVYVYYSDVDTLMHRFNDQDSRVELQFGLFSSLFEKAFLDKLSPASADETLLILTADHGSMATPRYEHYELSGHPELMDFLVMQPTCENRMAFFYVKPGRQQDVQDYVSTTWPGDFTVITSKEALDSGLLGPGPHKPDARERIGDLIAVAHGDAYLWWAPKYNHMQGRHGGLSPEEMLVPFFALPLGRLKSNQN